MAIKKLGKTMIRKTFSLLDCETKEFDPTKPLSVSGIANMASEDRVGDIVPKEAWTLDNYNKNPVILFNHCYDHLVGRATAIDVTDNGLEVTAEVGNPSAGYEMTESQKMVRSLIAQGILKAFSVGFIPLDAEYDEKNGRFIIKKAELLEISFVSVPCQQDSLVTEVKSLIIKEEKAMEEEMKKLLETIAADVKACKDKTVEILNKLSGSNGEEKPKEPSPIEESLRVENIELKAMLSEMTTFISKLN